MVESRYVLYGLVSGFIAAIPAAIAMALYRRSILSFVLCVAISSGTKHVTSVISALNSIYWLAIVGPFINMSLLGALIGVIADVLSRKLRNPVLLGLVAGAIYVAVFQAAPLYGLYQLYGSCTSKLLSEIGISMFLIPSILYIAVMTLLCIKGESLVRRLEAKPHLY